MAREMFKRPGDPYDIEFSINGVKHNVSDKFPATTSLNDYIRDVAGLKGTKYMCREGGCGSCAVTVTHAGKDNKAETMSINSCLCPLYSVDGWHIGTVEGIGNQKDGFHPIQERLAKYNGTQCGYCTPGFVMAMYGLLHQNSNATEQDIEDSFDGQICRCTGYRSILDAMKSFGSDSTSTEKKIVDIEDLNKHLCPKTGQMCKKTGNDSAVSNTMPRKLDLDLRETKWYRPLDLTTLVSVMKQEKTSKVRLCFGNTSTGIFKHEGPYDAYIDLRAISELYTYKENPTNVQFGAGTTLTKLLSQMQILKDKTGYHYGEGIARHLKVIAGSLVRNAGCIAGNLMIKHAHPEFPSDIFTITEAVGAQVHILDSTDSSTSKVTMTEFLKQVDMKGKVITLVEFPIWNTADSYRSFKITPRWQNAHAYVNAAFKIAVNNRQITSQPRIVFGGISPDTVHASQTEAYLNGKTLSDQTIREALKTLAAELQPTTEPLVSSAKYRKELATNLLYKTLLEIYKSTDSKIQSGGKSMDRSLSSGIQDYQEKPSEFPITQALPKKTAILQASGEAEYINDIPIFKQELAAAMVLSSVGVGTIKNVDTTEALKIPGVIRYIGAADIPTGGVNNGYSNNWLFKNLVQEVFVTKQVDFAGQLIGLILAETSPLAIEAARRVKVTYENVQTPVVYIEDAIAKNTVFDQQTKEKSNGNTTEALKTSAFVVEGDILERTQTHFYMENQVALCVPCEDGLDVYSTAQWGEMVQHTAAEVLGKPLNYVNVIIPRLGGAFGGKMTNSPAIASAAAVAAEATGRPIRLIVDLSSNMKYSSRRFPILCKYKAGCDAQGKIQALELTVYIDSGSLPTPFTNDFIPLMGDGYKIPNFKCKVMQMKTNKAMAGPCRAPSAVAQGLIFESVMEHLAKQIKQHPILFKEINLLDTTDFDVFGVKLEDVTVKECWTKLKTVADITNRMAEVKKFNENNTWRKRGLSMCTSKYPMVFYLIGFPSAVSIFAADGTVTAFTTGVEMGQGLYMKVAQAVAKSFGIPLDDVKVRPNQNSVLPNGHVTGGSTSSEKSVASVLKACNVINERLKPIKEKMPDADWKTVVKEAYTKGIPLFESSLASQDGPKYNTYMVAATETEVDVLTGEFQIKRVDIMGDIGQSMNPTIDIGQIEGSFVMGLGAYLTEDVHFDRQHGHVLNDGTWEYKPPTTKDIPIDWRVHLLKDTPSAVGVLSSKAIGEPAVNLGVSALLSIKSAVEDFRKESANEDTFIPIEAPFTVEKIQQSTNITLKNLGVANVP